MTKPDFSVMQSRKSKHMKPCRNKKNMLLSVVALVLVVMIAVMSVYAWIETTSSIQITNNNKGQFGSPLYTVANIDTTSGDSIPLSKFFNDDGNTHLASASSADGKDFYFKKLTTSSTGGYRKGTIDDVNVNYISFALQLKVNKDTDFYFEQVPTITLGGEDIGDSVRVAITKDNEATKIFSQTSGTFTSVNKTDGTNGDSTVYSFADYSKNNDNAGPIFSVTNNKEDAKAVDAVVTFTMWFEDQAGLSREGKQVQVKNLTLSTKVTIPTLVFCDRTTAYNGYTDSTKTAASNGLYWVGNDSAKLYVYDATTGACVEMRASGADSSGAPIWKTVDENGKNTLTESFVTNTSANIYFLRAASTSTASSVNPNSSTTYWNKWTATLDGAKAVYQGTTYTYTAYGTSDSSGNGYGTWGEVSLIQFDVDASASSLVAKPATELATAEAAHVSLNFTYNSTSYGYEMNYKILSAGSSTEQLWRCYLPTDILSQNISYTFKVEKYNSSTSAYSLAYTLAAGARGDSVTYAITSASTGYWAPPSTVTVSNGTGESAKGTVTVSGGASGATTVKVTKGTTVTLTCTPNEAYAFAGWYTDAACTTAASIAYTINSTTRAATASLTATNDTYTYYAKYKAREFVISATPDPASSGNTVTVADGSTNTATGETTVSINVAYGGAATFTATASSDYDFVGWYKDAACTEAVSGATTTFTLSNINASSHTTYYAKFKIKDATYYYLLGTFTSDGWTEDDSKNLMAYDSTTGKYSITMSNLSTSTTYKFKVKKVTKTVTGTVTEQVYYTQNNATFSIPCENAPFSDANTGTDAKLNVSSNGDYTFTFDPTTVGSETLTIAAASGSSGTNGQFKAGDVIYFDISGVGATQCNIWLNAGAEYVASCSPSWNSSTDRYINNLSDGIVAVTLAKDIDFSTYSGALCKAPIDDNSNNWDNGNVTNDTTKLPTAGQNMIVLSKYNDNGTTKATYSWGTYGSGGTTSNVTITFNIESTDWVNNDSAVVWAYDRSTSTAYEMTKGTNVWTVSVPSTVTYISFYRCRPAGFSTTKVEGTGTTAGYWNLWEPEGRGSNTTYKTSGDGSGVWQ